MISEVGSGQVAIFPTFKGFRKAVTDEADSSTKSAGSIFTRGFSSAGTTAGKGFGGSFSSASSAGLKSAQAEVAKTAAALSAARLKEQNAAGSVRVAETALADARSRYAADSVQVVRAEERLASSERALQSTQDSVTSSSKRLAAAQQNVADASVTAEKAGGRLSTAFERVKSAYGTAGNDSGRKFVSGFSDILGGVVGANILTGAGFAVGRGINDVISTGISAGLKSVQLASDLNETKSAVSQVFGADAASGIVAFSKTANKALGQTQQQALAGAQTFGIFGKAAGLQGSKLSGFSTNLVTLAGDLASFYNTTPDDAIEALSAGLRGESEPLRRYGVLLDDATLKQKALSLGIYDGNGILTQQQRVLAAQAVIMDQTSIAQGDFARTSDGLANSQRVLAAGLADAQTQLGTYLLPAFTGFVSYANSDILPRLGEIIDRVGPKLSAAFVAAGPGFHQLADDAGPLVDKLADLVAEKGIPGLISAMDDLVTAAPQWIDTFSAIDKSGSEFLDGFFQSSVDLHNSIVKLFTLDNPGNPTGQKGPGGGGAGGGVGDGDPSYDFGKKQAVGVGLGVVAGTPGAVQKVNDLLTNVKAPLLDPATGALNFATLGQNFGQGLADGITSKKGAVGTAATGLAAEAVKQIKSTMKISSPSKVTRGLGGFAGDGYVLGLLDRTRAVQNAASQLAVASLTNVGSYAGASGSAAGAGFPSMVTLVDKDGSILARTQAQIDDYDAGQSATQARGSRGF